MTFDSLLQNVKAVAVLTAEPTEVSTKAQVRVTMLSTEPIKVSTKAHLNDGCVNHGTDRGLHWSYDM